MKAFVIFLVGFIVGAHVTQHHYQKSQVAPEPETNPEKFKVKDRFALNVYALVEIDGVECIRYSGHKKGGLSCDWSGRNNGLRELAE